MIDPAIIDLTHQMSRQPPALVRESRAVAQGADWAETWARTVGERNVRAFEHDTDRWIVETERQVTGLVREFAGTEILPHHLSQLSQIIAITEEMLDAEARGYRLVVKQADRPSKRTGSASPGLATVFRSQRKRLLHALARWGIARSDFILVLRSLHAEYDPAGRDGPVFDDAKALGDYLRAAAA